MLVKFDVILMSESFMRVGLLWYSQILQVDKWNTWDNDLNLWKAVMLEIEGSFEKFHAMTN